MREYINKITLANCEDVLRELPDNCVDLVLTDPPYGIGMDGGNVGYKGFNDLPKKDWDNSPLGESTIKQIKRIAKNYIIWGGNYFNLPPARCFLVWDKGAGFKNRTFAECELATTSFDQNAKIFNYDPLARGDYKGKLHPTQKPIQLFKWCLQQAKLEVGAIVLDCFSGSGTTALACSDMDYNFICIEKDEEYYNASVKRLEDHKRQGRLF